METWGDMETWRHGDMGRHGETWRHGDTETWGDMETWRHGNMETWRQANCIKIASEHTILPLLGTKKLVLKSSCMDAFWYIHVWQSWVEIKHYSFAYFDHVTTFKANFR